MSQEEEGRVATLRAKRKRFKGSVKQPVKEPNRAEKYNIPDQIPSGNLQIVDF